MHFLLLIFIFHSSDLSLPWAGYMAICHTIHLFASTLYQARLLCVTAVKQNLKAVSAGVCPVEH